NGLHPRFITQQLSDKMYTAGFKTIYLSLETIDFNIHRKIDNKVQIEEFIQAVQYLKKSGFNRTQLHAYLLIGLPEIDIESIRQSIDFLNEQGIISHLAEYSPIPFTQGYQKLFSTDSIDPLYHNNAIFPGVSQQTRDKLMAIKVYHSRLRHTS
ncbi:MAG: radical SAM protein, partial [candidate division WOR-3 bacterium]